MNNLNEDVMQQFYEELQQMSNTNIEKRLMDTLQYKKQQDELLTDLIESLKNDILDNYVEKMKMSSEKGYKHCVLYAFGQHELYNGKHKKTFLTRGPISDRGFGKGMDFFYNKELIPIIDTLRHIMSPFTVELKYNRAKKIHSIVTYW